MKRLNMSLYDIQSFRQNNKRLIQFHIKKRRDRDVMNDKLFELEYKEEVLDGLFSRIDPFNVVEREEQIRQQIINILNK